MSKAKFRWERAAARDRATDARAARLGDLAAVDAEVQRRRHEVDLAFLKDLLATYGRALAEYHREKLLASIAYVGEHPTHTLGPVGTRSGWRAYWYRIKVLLVRGMYRAPADVPPEVVAAARRKRVLRAKRKEEFEARRPAWQADPSLLPLKPPGAQP